MKFQICTFVITYFIIISCEKENNEINNLDLNELKTTWILDKFIDKATNKSDTLPENYSAGFTFHGKDCITVIGPCNSGPGKYEISGNKITIIKLAMTERGCNILGYEEQFTNNLSGYYSILNDTLTIISDLNTDLVLFRADSTEIYDCYDF